MHMQMGYYTRVYEDYDVTQVFILLAFTLIYSFTVAIQWYNILYKPI